MKKTMINRNKLNGKRFAAAAVAGLSAAAVVITAVLSGAIEAEAADTLLGIEKLRSRYKESGSEYVILEVVPDRSAAEIGYLVSGYEPVLCEWDEEEMAWKGWQNALCALPNYERRRDFIEDKKEELREYYAKQGLTQNFPVEAVEEVYEEGDARAEGFEKVVSDDLKKVGWFEKSTVDGLERYQLAFKWRGKYTDDYPIDKDLLYYTVSSATEITSDVAGGLEPDRFIYVLKDNVYVCIGTWEEVSDQPIASISDNSAEEEEDDRDESKPDDGKKDDKDDDNGGTKDDGDGNGGDGTGTGNGDDGNGDTGDAGDDSGNGDTGDVGGDSGDGGAGDAGGDSGNGGAGNNGGDDSGNGTGSNDGGNSGGDAGDDNADNGGDSGNDSGNGGNGSESGNTSGSGSSNAGDNGANVNSGDTAKTIGTAFVGLRQGKWFRLVANEDPASGSDGNTESDNKPGLQDGTASDDRTDSDDNTSSDDRTGTDDNTGANGSGDNTASDDKTGSGDSAGQDDKTGSDDNAGTDDNPAPDDNADTDDNAASDDGTDPDDGEEQGEDGPAADDPDDGEDKESVKKALAEDASAYYLVAFEKVRNYNELSEEELIYSVDDIVVSENGEYIFVEWDGADESLTRQEYSFSGREIWCKNTFKSNEWFRKYVLNMDKKDYEDFRIKVLTFTPQELNQMEQIPAFDFLYLNSGLKEAGKGDNSGDSGDVSGNDSGSGDDSSSGADGGNGSDNSRGTDQDGRTDLSASASIKSRWLKLVAKDDVEISGGSVNAGNTGDADGSKTGGDSGNNSGSDGNSGSGNNDSTGAGSGAGDNSGSGNDGGTGAGSGSGDNSGTEAGSGSGDNSGTEAGNGSGGNGGTGAGSESGGNNSSEAGSESGSNNSSETGSGSEDNSGAEDTDGSKTGGSGTAPDDSKGVGAGKGKGARVSSQSISGNDITEPASGTAAYTADNDLSAGLLKFFFDKTVAGAMPCLVDGAILYVKDDGGSIISNGDLEGTNIFRLAAMLCQENLSEWYEEHRNNYAGLTTAQLLKGIVEDADKNFVTEQVYCRYGSDSIVNDQFFTATIYKDGREIEPGFQGVLDEINLENLYREADTSGNYKPLSTSISQAKAVRHILNYKDRRKVETKKHIRVLEIQPALADNSELTLEQLKTWAPGVETADITLMTTAEFIGKIEKLNENYDLIYFGTSKDHLNVRCWKDLNYRGKPDSWHVPAGTVFNDSDMDGLIYYNVGDLRVISLPLAGLLTSEYPNGNRNGYTYFHNYTRYGGNDISKEKMNALLSFLDGSYPIIIADDFLEQPVTVYDDIEYMGARIDLSEGEYRQSQLYELGIVSRWISSVKIKKGYEWIVYEGDNFDGRSETFSGDENDLRTPSGGREDWNDKIGSMIIRRVENVTPERRINEDHIDNCTYLYELVKKAMDDKYVNFYAWSDITDDSELFKFYLNRPKVSLTETVVNGLREEGSDIYYIDSDINGRYNLQYRFKIQNEGTASYSTRYQCRLYIDVNSDGKFSAQEEIEDISVTRGGNSVSSDALYADREYVVSRQVPMGYKGLLPWRVEITQVDNSNIYTSMSGYTKLNGMDKEVIKICQINRNGADVIDLNWEVHTRGRHFNTLVYGGDYGGVHYPGISDEFELDITTMDINTFHNRYYANNEYLKDFNMLILGFSDMYGDFAGDAESGPMGAIVDFINSGKSVLLGHDTTSFFNSPEPGLRGYPWRNNLGDLRDINWLDTRNASTLNKYVRPLVGMDRYGVLQSDIVRRGDILTRGTEDYDAVVNSGKEVAYKPKSGKKETVPETHGYTYSLISAKDQNYERPYMPDKYWYTKWNLVNPGEYHRFPEVVFENKYSNIRYDASYFWNNWDGKENDSARYGELEKVANNGEVWNIHASQVNKGQITEYPYKLKEDFEIALTHAQYYALDYTADDDGDGQSDLVVWYCLGKRTSVNGPAEWETTIYSQSPNDVRNNYYIYNKGNITYTGMGHARKNWNEEWYTFEEAKLFINTMIAAYQAGIKDPQISVLKKGVPEAEEMKLLYRYYDKGNNFSLDDEVSADAYEKIYFTVQDINFVKGTRKIESHVYYQDDSGGEVINVDGEEIKVNRLPDHMFSARDDSAADANNLTSGGIYYIRVPRDIMKKCEDGLELYFEAQSTITTGTTKVNEYITDKAYAKLQVLQAYLFNLE